MKSLNGIRVLTVPEGDSTPGRASERGVLFEQLIGVLLETLAFRVKKRLSANGTEIDMVAESMVTGEQAIVQCKDTRANIDTAALQQLHSQAVTHQIQVALLFCTTSLTPQAREYLDERILPGFPRYKVYGSTGIVDLLAAGKSLHRHEIVEAFVLSQGLEASAWALCLYQSRLFWTAAVRSVHCETASHWILLQAKGALITDNIFLAAAETAFQRRFKEVDSVCVDRPLFNLQLQAVESWRAPIIIRETGLHSLLAGRPDFLRPSRKLRGFVSPRVVSALRDVCDPVWEAVRASSESLLDRLLPDEVKGGLTEEEIESILASLGEACELFVREREEGRIKHTLHALLTGGEQSVKVPLTGVSSPVRSIILALFGLQEFSARSRAIGAAVRFSLAVTISIRFPEMVCELLDPEFSGDAETLFEVDEIEVNHHSYRVTVIGTSESVNGIRSARLIEDALERLLMELEQHLFLLGVRLFRVEVKVEGALQIGTMSFRLHNRGILKLLMGEQLYDSKFVFIRELVQNAIDASRLTCQEAPPAVSIEIEHSDRLFITVTDQGVGMDRYHIERYLTTVGVSMYRSSDLKAMVTSNPDFIPISRFGIGFLSAFMVADEIRIRTRMSAMADGLELVMRGATDTFSLRTVAGVQTGTSVRIRVAPHEVASMATDRFAPLLNYIKRTLVCPPTTVYLSVPTRSEERIESINWRMEPTEVLRRLVPEYSDWTGVPEPKLSGPMCFQSEGLTLAVVPNGKRASSVFHWVRPFNVTRFGIRVESPSGELFSILEGLFTGHYVHVDERLASTEMSVDRTKLTLDESSMDASAAMAGVLDECIKWIKDYSLPNDTLLARKTALLWAMRLADSLRRPKSNQAGERSSQSCADILRQHAEDFLFEVLEKVEFRTHESKGSGFVVTSVIGLVALAGRLSLVGGRIYYMANSSSKTRERSGSYIDLSSAEASWISAFVDCIVEVPDGWDINKIRSLERFKPFASIFKEPVNREAFAAAYVEASEIKATGIQEFLPGCASVCSLAAFLPYSTPFAVDLREGRAYQTWSGWIDRPTGLRESLARIRAKNRRHPFVVLDYRDPIVKILTDVISGNIVSTQVDNELLQSWRRLLVNSIGASNSGTKSENIQALTEMTVVVVKAYCEASGRPFPNILDVWRAEIVEIAR